MKASIIFSPKRKKPFLRAAVSFTVVAAVFFIGIFGSSIFPRRENKPAQTAKNSFNISAYAYDGNESGQLSPKAIDLTQDKSRENSEDTVVISGGKNNEYAVNLIKLIGFKCDGENIEKVIFSIDQGNLKIPNKDWETKKIASNLETAGKTLTINYTEGSEKKNLVFWESEQYIVYVDSENNNNTFHIGTSKTDDTSVLVPSMTTNITVTAYFNDGSKSEKSIEFDAEKGSLTLSEIK